MISQITPAGIRPARRARSTLASVCPVRSSTPPAFAFSGLTCPGCTRSSGFDAGSTATCIVCARSCAETPVVTPWRASIVTVKGVCRADSFFAVISSRPSASQRSGLSARQIQPRASLAMKLIASGVANCAAITRSPSFSRSSSSQTTTILPRADLLDRLLDRGEGGLRGSGGGGVSGCAHAPQGTGPAGPGEPAEGTSRRAGGELQALRARPPSWSSSTTSSPPSSSLRTPSQRSSCSRRSLRCPAQ